MRDSFHRALKEELQKQWSNLIAQQEVLKMQKVAYLRVQKTKAIIVALERVLEMDFEIEQSSLEITD